MYIRYYTTAGGLTNNVFIDNSAAYEVYIQLNCRPGLDLSLGSSRCIQCSENWHCDLIGIVVAAFIAGIALVIFMLALNMTVAVGTLNGILFYANIVAANEETYFLSFKGPEFITVLISRLNLGYDTCFFLNNAILSFSDNGRPLQYKNLSQLCFTAYVIILIIIVIVASEYSSKFAKTISKGNPVAVLATMILLSYAKIFKIVLASGSLFYLQPAYGSHTFNHTASGRVTAAFKGINNTEFKAIYYFLFSVSILILFLCVIFTALVFSWQWLLQYQDKAVFKWVRCQNCATS